MKNRKANITYDLKNEVNNLKKAEKYSLVKSQLAYKQLKRGAITQMDSWKQI